MGEVKKRVKRRLPLMFIFLILLLGVSIYMYPIVSDWITQYTAHTEIASYNTAVQEMDTSERDELYRQAVEYNKALRSGNSDVTLNYESMLSVTDAIGYVDIPKLSIYLPIYHGVEEDALKHGVGHMNGTSLPVGGSSTHSVLAAHTGLPTAELFTSIDLLVEGDVFYVHVLGEVLAYKVNQISVVLPEDDSEIHIVDGEDYVTLLTCTPYGINDHRLLVRGTRIEYIESDDTVQAVPPTEPEEEEKLPIETVLWFWGAVVVTAILIIILLILFLPVGKKRDKNKNEKLTQNE